MTIRGAAGFESARPPQQAFETHIAFGDAATLFSMNGIWAKDVRYEHKNVNPKDHIMNTPGLLAAVWRWTARNVGTLSIFIVPVLLIQGCAKSTRTVGIDLKHGEAWVGLAETLVAGGFRVVPINESIDAAMLKKIGVLLIMAPTTPYADAEVQAIA